ncbi:MAG: glycerol kinase GlpK [Candidatus Sericytochromatia bacterium]|uniref:Glycerol kinase n=1 Tax=Candidatus Tanganyikabacteria bacterium TaxID=2961651 RepID=A0A937X4Q3_9BACT|nr:glycerol kinase GlpK [Candidatus Tanganyikabacteria bacterium]
MSDRYILAIDQGTTGTTVLVIDTQGRVRGRAYREVTQFYPQPGWVEHDAEEIWRGAVEAIGDALKAAGTSGEAIAAIGITNQRETVVVWDRATGKPIHKAIVWQCRRTAQECDRLRAEGHADTIRGKTGLVLDAYFSGTKAAWILDAVKGSRERAERGDLAFGTIDTWLIYNLTGGRFHVTDPSNASRTLLFDLNNLAWDEGLCRLFRVPKALLPTVGPNSGECGRTADIGALPAGIPVAGVAGDQQAALFGQACFEVGSAKNTYGTGCFLLANTGERAVTSRQNLLTTVAWKVGNRTVYALEGSVFIAGAAVQWLRDGLGIIKQAAETEQLARSVPDNGGVYLVPAFVGLGAPYWDQYARGAMLGLTRGSTRAHIARATLEAIAYQTADLIGGMEADAGRLKALKVDGGAAANDFLMQFQADILGLPIHRGGQVESTARGAAWLAGLGVGFWADTSALPTGEDVAIFEPAMAADQRQKLRADWQKAVERSRNWESPEPARQTVGV